MKRGPILVTNGYYGIALASEHPESSKQSWPFATLGICIGSCAFEVADLHSKVCPMFLLLDLVVHISRMAGSSAT